MNRPLSQTLTDLITLANEVITRPRGASGLNAGGHFEQLAAEVRHAESAPAENIRTTRAAMIMVFALEEFRGGEQEAGSPWLMLAGTALPLLRVEAWVALNNEKQARGI